ncbi:hypothetical protein PSTT_13137 [Puccinia striiformis]|uniref:t-SNARE coiled-coil homology domain-containing protein n=1 Tax=Puccinia striiformis TaxID=27350 RepID=A0A2S4UT67_9BASI|nr:hypothetical protein PSTT_13137 [Puccinia striiformis]
MARDRLACDESKLAIYYYFHLVLLTDLLTLEPYIQNNNYAQEPAPPSSRQTNQPHNGNHDDKLSSTKESGNIDSYEMKEKYLDMPSFMDEVSSLNDGIRTVNENVDRVKDFHNRLLSELDEQQHQSISNQLATLTSDTSRLTKNLKNRIHSLQLSISHNQAQFNNDINQLNKRVDRNTNQEWSDNIRLFKPDATPEEIRQAVDSDDGGQIFSQALMTSNRYGDARAAFNEVKERHEDVKRIEQTITELMEMFNDLATMVEEQDQLIQNVENNAGEIQRDVEQAGQHITKARDSAASARRKRWICFFVMILILAIVAAIIAIVVVTQRKNNTIVATSTPSTQARA